MQNRSFGRFTLLSLLAMALFGAACKHPQAQPPAAPAQPPAQPSAQPTVTLQASPTFIQKGQSVTLTWSSTNATSLALRPGVGSVAPEGSTKVSPTESTSYAITATGPGGQAEQSVRVTVGESAPPPAPSGVSETAESAFDKDVHDVYFDLDKSDIRGDARDALAKTAEYLRSYAQVKVVLEGDCDERGSTEYNLGLGQRRADAAKQFLESLGIGADRMQTISYGKEKPVCEEHTEECWQRNRRAHFSLAH
jgi:peptidoglycan-associated lipoprotein